VLRALGGVWLWWLALDRVSSLTVVGVDYCKRRREDAQFERILLPVYIRPTPLAGSTRSPGDL